MKWRRQKTSSSKQPVEFTFAWSTFATAEIAYLLTASAIAYEKRPIDLVKTLAKSLAENLIARIESSANAPPLRLEMDAFSNAELTEVMIVVGVVKAHLQNRATESFFRGLSEACLHELANREGEV